MEAEEYLLPKEAARILGVSTTTLHNWEKRGRLRPFVTSGKHRRYLAEDVYRLKDEGTRKGKGSRRKICYYWRDNEVSDTKGSLFRSAYPNHEIIFDTRGDRERKGLNSILDEAFRGHIQELVVTQEDELVPGCFGLIQKIFGEKSHGRIMVLNSREDREIQILSALRVLTCELSRLRTPSSEGVHQDLESSDLPEPTRDRKN